MNKVVVKFGGSNLRNGKDISKILDIIIDYGNDTIVVLSAVYGLTDELNNACLEAKYDFSSIDNNCVKISNRVLSLIINVFYKDLFKREFNKQLDLKIESLKRKLKIISKDKLIDEQVRDEILSIGESISVAIFHFALLDRGVKNVVRYPSDIGLFTNNVNSVASINLSKSKFYVSELNNINSIVIVPGFFGVSDDNKINLIGRGGTDYSASAIAYCVKAKYLDIWKDVDGFCTADPKLVENTQTITNLSYKEASELAYFGASILHPKSIEPVQELDIPTRIFNVNRADICKPASVIYKDSVADCVKSVTYNNSIGIVKLKGADLGGEKSILSDVTKILSLHGINILSVLTSQTSINLILNNEDISRVQSLIKSINNSFIREVDIISDLCLLAIVGENINKLSAMFNKITKTLNFNNIPVNIFSFGASDVSTYLIVNTKYYKKSLQLIHSLIIK
ncbi:aspartate kinase [Marinilabiliaceae bacterium JC040]|nr:aspartate kinase [Marinilabiliaceae bacterium JC040]